jgi:hypothetical protein
MVYSSVSIGSPAPQLRPTAVTRPVVLEKCDYFVDVQLWPLKKDANPEGWLQNFLPEEEEHAHCLLHAFQYFAAHLVDELFRSAIQNLSTVVCAPTESFLPAQTRWRSFLAQAIFTYVEGEEPNASDSGFAFVRRARNLIEVDESRIKMNADALLLAMRSGSRPPIIFVDDFVGSGDQFVKCWHRRRKLDRSVSTSFAEVAAATGGDYFYCPLVVTATGAERIRRECREVQLQPVHVLSTRDSALAPDSYVWPTHLQPTASEFLERASKRAGIFDWKGYADLGLTIGFAHCVPDATLPLFVWKENGWTPLVPAGRLL